MVDFLLRVGFCCDGLEILCVYVCHTGYRSASVWHSDLIDGIWHQRICVSETRPISSSTGLSDRWENGKQLQLIPPFAITSGQLGNKKEKGDSVPYDSTAILSP